jgi:uncharacterized protein (TIGR03067 family)
MWINGSHLKRANAATDASGHPAVSFQLNKQAGKWFYELTSKNQPTRTEAGLFHRRLAIILDGQILSAPTINSAIGEEGIIAGNFTQQEVDRLVTILRAGALPAPLKPAPVSEEEVKPANQAPSGPEKQTKNQQKDPSPSDKEKLQGVWRASRAERQGKVISQVKEGKQTWSFDGDQATMSNNNGSDDWKATFHLNAGQDPKEIDFEIQEGPNQGKKVLGIYALKGDDLTLCICSAGSNRPGQLMTKDPNGVTWFLERRRPAKEKKGGPGR